MQIYAVREITSYLRELLDSSPVLGDVWIAGECSNVSRPSSGHVYFTLKDANAQLRAVFFTTSFTNSADRADTSIRRMLGKAPTMSSSTRRRSGISTSSIPAPAKLIRC